MMTAAKLGWLVPGVLGVTRGWAPRTGSAGPDRRRGDRVLPRRPFRLLRRRRQGLDAQVAASLGFSTGMFLIAPPVPPWDSSHPEAQRGQARPPAFPVTIAGDDHLAGLAGAGVARRTTSPTRWAPPRPSSAGPPPPPTWPRPSPTASPSPSIPAGPTGPSLVSAARCGGDRGRRRRPWCVAGGRAMCLVSGRRGTIFGPVFSLASLIERSTPTARLTGVIGPPMGGGVRRRQRQRAVAAGQGRRPRRPRRAVDGDLRRRSRRRRPRRRGRRLVAVGGRVPAPVRPPASGR